MSKKSLPSTVFRKLDNLYARMEAAYVEVADEIGLSCAGCTDNCCTSYFQHHTYVEWAYLWKGLKECDEKRRRSYIDRAEDYVRQAKEATSRGIRPNIMCPLNDDGLCGLYRHRLMICRMHGVPNILVRPDMQVMRFPGCWQSQELCKNLDPAPEVNRTSLYKELVNLEVAFVGPNKIRKLPRVDMTLAEMIVMGPPRV
jgi:hypothetical protein